MEWIKKLWKDSVGSQVIAWGIISLIAFVLDRLQLIDIKAILCHPLPLYWTIILLLIVYIIYKVITWYKNKTLNYEKYTEDVIQGVKYRWEYYYGTVSNIQEICSCCDMPKTNGVCPICKVVEYSPEKLTMNQVESYIKNQIRIKYQNK